MVESYFRKSTQIILFLLFWGPTLPLFAQSNSSFSKIDRHARQAPADVTMDVESLTNYLIEPATEDLHRIRAFYAWLTENIAYDQEAKQDERVRINQSLKDILRRRKAICYGYASLFAEMCQLAGIRAVIIPGYSKHTRTAKPQLDEPDHAWNAVQIGANWYLMDITWDASLLQQSNAFAQPNRATYFLSPPTEFIQDHLPAVPMWQLLDCPIQPDAFKASNVNPSRLADSAEACIHFQDSIDAWLQLNQPNQRLATALDTWLYHPTPKNRDELGHQYMDWAASLSDRTGPLMASGQNRALIQLQDSILYGCEQAQALTHQLYDWQLELYVSTLINQSVVLYNQHQKNGASDQGLEQVVHLLERAEELIEELPQNLHYTSFARQQCQSYLETVRQQLD